VPAGDAKLKGAISLARLHRAQGRSPEARAVLAPVYAAFTEGFERPDLKAAKLLLEEIG
jgi:predicted ATPase